MKINEFWCRKEFGEVVEKWWKSGGEGRPGGMRDGRILRFAEAGTDSASCSFCLVLLTRLSPQKGWPYSIAPRIPPGPDHKIIENWTAGVSKMDAQRSIYPQRVRKKSVERWDALWLELLK